MEVESAGEPLPVPGDSRTYCKMMVDGIYSYLVPIARTIAGFGIGVMLGIVGGWTAITFNFMVEFPWSLEVHRNIYIVGIGLGGGIGSYFGWMNLSIRWYLVIVSIILVLAGGVAGAYLGLGYGQIADPSYLGRRYTIDNMMHWGAAIGGIVVATVVGLFYQLRAHSH